MNTDPLLEAVFRPDDETLGPALAAARRRRVRRVWMPVVAAGACACAAWMLFPRPAEAPALVSAPPPKPIIEKVSTRPLAANEVVRTVPGSLTIVSTASANAGPTRIAEADLLQIFGPGKVALVGSGSGQRLIQVQP
jgi:hypothetical protein